MMNLLKFAANPQLQDRDPEGHMFELAAWSPHRARMVAAQEGIELTDEHWEVVFALREHYRENGNVSARRLTAYLERSFAAGEGRRRLYEMFPRGPVRQASLIAGLPPPTGSSDPSFGSVQ